MAGALGRLVPPDFDHVSKYPLTALPPEARPTCVPLWIGVNWYVEFDTPEQDAKGNWWVARDGKLTTVRGGHSVCLEPAVRSQKDPLGWWSWFNQGQEGICVSEGGARTMGLLNRRRYQPRWLYDRCKERDGDPNGEGTFVHVGLDVVRELGMVRAKAKEAQNLTPHALDGRKPNAADGIAANRWVTSVDDAFAVLGHPGRDYAVLLNSWGRQGYPHRVRVPAEVLDTLRKQDGELAVVTDR